MNLLRKFLPTCQNCSEPSWELFCASCLKLLRFQAACKTCGRYPLSKHLENCLPCSNKSSPWKNFFISFAYVDGVQTWIQDIKDNCHPERFRELEHKHLPILDSKNYDAIIPVSGDPDHVLERLFDPAEVLAKRLSTLLKIPVQKKVFLRKKFLKSQRTQTLSTRKKFLNQIVTLNEDKRPKKAKKLLVVDDIATTTATLERHATLLTQKGHEVDIYSLARTLKET